MYAGIMDSALGNLNQSNQQLDALRKNITVGNNVAQFHQALTGGQDKLLAEAKASGNDDAYNDMFMRHASNAYEQASKPSLAMILKGMFGGI